MAGVINKKLIAGGVRSKVDVRDIRPGEKFYEWEKKGVPIRIELGPKDVANNSAILVRRDTAEKTVVSLDSLTDTVASLLIEIQSNLFNRALGYQKSKTKVVNTWDEFAKEIKAGNFVLAHWSGGGEEEAKIKEATGATVRCIPFDQKAESGQCVFSGKPSKGRVLFATSY
jgi:prolyl-tRNA synthetase